MNAAQAKQVAMDAENAWYDSYEQDGLDCRALGFEPATSKRTLDLRRDASDAWREWRRLRDAEQQEREVSA